MQMKWNASPLKSKIKTYRKGHPDRKGHMTGRSHEWLSKGNSLVLLEALTLSVRINYSEQQG